MNDFRVAVRPRPVADAPVEALVDAAPELAKRWLMALIASGDLSDAARLPVAELVQEAPALVARVARSLSSDAELERLLEGGDASGAVARAGALAGASDPAAAVRAVEALRVVVWEAAVQELRDAGAAQVGELAARLGHVAAQVAAAAAGAVAPAGPPASSRLGATLASEPPLAGPGPDPMAIRAVDGRSPPPPADASATVIPFLASPPIPGPRPDIGDVPDEGPAAWIGSIGRRLERFAEDRTPFAVLLIEVADIDRLRHAADADELAGLVAAVERALSGELRPADVLTREGPGRYWLVTPETDREGAQLLAERMAAAVHGSSAHHGAPLQVAIGTAVCPDDGDEPAALAARADVGVYAARAAGRSTAPAEGPEGPA